MAKWCCGLVARNVLVVVCCALLVGQVHSADYTYISRSALRQVIREELGSLGRNHGGGDRGGEPADSQLRPMLSLILQHVQEISRRRTDPGERSPSFVQALEGRLDAFTRQLDAKSRRQEQLCSSLSSDLHDVKTKVDFLMALTRQRGGAGARPDRSKDDDQDNSLVPRGRQDPYENPRDAYVPPRRPQPTPPPIPPQRPTLRYPRVTPSPRQQYPVPGRGSSSRRREHYPRRRHQQNVTPRPWPTRRPRVPEHRPWTRPTTPSPSTRRPYSPSSSRRTYPEYPSRQERPQPVPRPDWGVTTAPKPTRPNPGVSIYRRAGGEGSGQCPSYLSDITGSEVFRKARDSMIGVWMKDTGVRSDTVWAVESSNALHWSSVNQYQDEDAFRRRTVATLHQLSTPCSGLGAIIYKGDLFCQSHGRDTRSLQIMRYSLRDRRVIARGSISSRTGGHVSHPYRGWAGVYLHLQLAVDELGLYAIFGDGEKKGLAIFRLDVNSLQTLETWHTEKPKDMIGPAFMICGVLYALDSHYAGYISYAYDTNTLQEKILPSSRIPVPIKDMSSVHYNPMDRKLYAWTMTRPKNHQQGARGRRIYGVAERVSLNLSGQVFLTLR